MNVPGSDEIERIQRIWEEVYRLKTEWGLGHQYLIERVSVLEQEVRRLRSIGDDWYGSEGDKEGGMRKELKEMINERSSVSIGWKAIMSILGFLTSVGAMVVVIIEHKVHGG